MKRSWNETVRYALYGALFGLCFPVGSVLFLRLAGQLGPVTGFADLITAAHQHILLYVIDSAPLFLGFVAALAGVRQDRLQAFSSSLERQVAQKTDSLRRALQQAEKANEMIVHMAEHDALTGLLNRRAFQGELERWLTHAQRYQRPLSLLFIDVDRFKTVNDVHGHVVGDEYLSVIAHGLEQVLRASDLVGRLGGDEFGVLLPETASAAAAEVARKLLHRLSESTLQCADQKVAISVSIGIASFPEHGPELGALMGFADAAMYEAKMAGGNSWRLYSPSGAQRDRLQSDLEWEARIRQALEHDQFVLFYQPVVDLAARATVGYEALLRLEDPDGMLISPSVFLEPAERFGLSVPIDRMVVRKASRRLGALGAAGPWMSLNLSPRALLDPAFADYIERMLAETGIAPGSLRFEVTEAAVLAYSGAVRTLAARLAVLQSGLIIDDFGLGPPTLRLLPDTTIELVKIDGSLIRGLGGHSANQKLVKSLVDLAHDHGSRVVAKCVEEPEVLALIAELGIDYVQGFAVGRPLESIEQAALRECGVGAG